MNNQRQTLKKVLLGASFGLLLIGVFAAIVIGALVPFYTAQSWSVARCRINGNRVVEHPDPDGATTWDAHVSWSYQVGGINYSLIDAEPEIFGIAYDKLEAEQVAARFRVGDEVKCFYDPGEPRKSVLGRTPPPLSAWLMAAVLLLAAIADVVFVILVTLRLRRLPRATAEKLG